MLMNPLSRDYLLREQWYLDLFQGKLKIRIWNCHQQRIGFNFVRFCSEDVKVHRIYDEVSENIQYESEISSSGINFIHGTELHFIIQTNYLSKGWMAKFHNKLDGWMSLFCLKMKIPS